MQNLLIPGLVAFRVVRLYKMYKFHAEIAWQMLSSVETGGCRLFAVRAPMQIWEMAMTADVAEITIGHETDGDLIVVRPVGKLDTLSAKTFETYLKNLISKKPATLLIDMEQVDYVTSFGLRSLLIVAKLLAPSGDKLVLFQVNQSVVDVLKISGFLKIMQVAESREDAKALAG